MQCRGFFSFKQGQRRTIEKKMSAEELAALRRQKAQEYKQAPPDAKPKIQICGECNHSVYDAPICPVSGYYHGQKKEHLVAGLLVDASKRQFTGSELMAAIDAVRIRWQPSRTQLVKADSTSLNIFQSFVYGLNWKMQRYGILYGTYDEVTRAVSVHSVYEPEQIGSETSFTMQPDAREERVNEIARLLGLKRVGCICTHPPRDEATVTLSGQELLLCAKEQSRFGDHCILITMGPNVETGHINAQCWQASEQCVQYFRMGILSEDPEDIRHVRSSIALEIAQEDTDKSGHKKCVIKESSCVLDTRWMTSYIAVEPFTSNVVGNSFIRISRPGNAPPTFANLRNFIQDSRRNRLKFVEQIADFHVLVFLAERAFSVKSDMPIITEAILAKDSQSIAAYEEMIREYLKGS